MIKEREKNLDFKMTEDEIFNLLEFLNDYFMKVYKETFFEEGDDDTDYLHAMLTVIKKLEEFNIKEKETIEDFERKSKDYVLTISFNELKHLVSFIEFYFLDYIRDFPNIDNIRYVAVICDAFRKFEDKWEKFIK